MKAEYQKILERLDELEWQGVIGAFDKRTIIDLSGDVIKEILKTLLSGARHSGFMRTGETLPAAYSAVEAGQVSAIRNQGRGEHAGHLLRWQQQRAHTKTIWKRSRSLRDASGKFLYHDGLTNSDGGLEGIRSFR